GDALLRGLLAGHDALVGRAPGLLLDLRHLGRDLRRQILRPPEHADPGVALRELVVGAAVGQQRVLAGPDDLVVGRLARRQHADPLRLEGRLVDRAQPRVPGGRFALGVALVVLLPPGPDAERRDPADLGRLRVVRPGQQHGVELRPLRLAGRDLVVGPLAGRDLPDARAGV